MQSIELEKAFDPKTFEDRIYALWQEAGAFKPADGAAGGACAGKPPFTVVIPPPNVTGVLHLGHGLNNSLQDIIIRYHRMKGEPTLWVPGTDHAGIATQNVVERRLRAAGTSRRELGRERFVEETWKVAREHHDRIAAQLAKIGASVDWSRERFTLDEGLSRAVREVFVTLYERGLLYKGNYLVNWCTSCGTALSDDEVDHEEVPGKMYHIRYPVVNGEQGAGSREQGRERDQGPGTRASVCESEVLPGAIPAVSQTVASAPPFPVPRSPFPTYIEIATTRPETLLGDTAVAVHPEDERYAALTGKMLALPLTDRLIPVIADSYVDREFGTGAVKITPAHDPNDWEMAKRQGLEVINILTPEGCLNDAVPEKYRGLTVSEAREAVLTDLKEGGFYIREEDLRHSVGHCYRCHTVIEPFLSEQWFVRMKPLAEKALASWRRGEIVFYPRKWENTYQHWLENIRDWCVSRQLWWGHRIPAWTCASCGEMSVLRDDPAVCPACGSPDIEQDPDVLDTWFSSWLWPFSTLGWEGGEKTTPDLSRFYPTSALVTAYDIIFFWVSRMIMAGLEFTGKAPFRDVVIHGLIRDKQGRKMSKSLGNGIDPIELVDQFGADAFKFTLAFLCAQGQDLLVDRESFRLGSKFVNKIWNASRYILMNLEGRSLVESPALLPVDRWIYARLNGAARLLGEAFGGYRFNEAAQGAYEFFWNDFCDWYVEATKLSTKSGDEAERDRAVTVLLDVLAEALRLLHPLAPFVTEEIYGKLPNTSGLLITAPYPEYDESRCDPAAEAGFALLKEVVTLVRTLRSEAAVPPEKRLHVEVRIAAEGARVLGDNAALVQLLAGIDRFGVEAPSGGGRPQGAIGLAGTGCEVFVFIAEAVDPEFLRKKFTKELEKDGKFIASLQQKLGNENFLKNAPEELVEAERLKLEAARKRSAVIQSYMRDL